MIVFPIGKIPSRLQSFFRRLAPLVHKPVFEHLWRYVLAVAIASGRRNVERLRGCMDSGACRQNVTDFLIAAPWDCAKVLREAVLQVIEKARIAYGARMYLILDGSKKGKRGKKMEGAHSYYVPMGGKKGFGHQFFLGALRVGHVVVPWDIKLYAPRPFARSERGKDLGIKYRTLNELAARIIEEFPPELALRFQLVVLFDAGLFNETVVAACEKRKFSWISRAWKNRAFWPDGRKGKVSVQSHAPGVLRYSGQEIRLPAVRGQSRFIVAARDGRMRKMDRVRAVFSRRKSDGNLICLVTNDFSLCARDVILAYTQRWSIEVLIKQLKQCLGLGDYRTGSFVGVQRHLSLVCLAHLALTHLGLQASKLPSDNANKTLKLPSIEALQDNLRGMVWRDHASRIRRWKNGKNLSRALQKLLEHAA